MPTIKQEYQIFLTANFKGMTIREPLFYHWDKGLRFDLQVGSTGTDEYFTEVVKRSSTLFSAVFEPDDTVFMVMHSLGWRRRKIKTSNYCLKQVRGLQKEEVAYSVAKKLYPPLYRIRNKWNIAILKVRADRINHENILAAIANTDFPKRQPRLTRRKTPFARQEIFFININKKLIFNMYDDRGLDIIASDKEILRDIYERHNGWIPDYDRGEIEAMMGVGESDHQNIKPGTLT